MAQDPPAALAGGEKMTAHTLSESVVEGACLAWLKSLGYVVLHLPAPQSEAARQAGGPDAAGETGA